MKCYTFYQKIKYSKIYQYSINNEFHFWENAVNVGNTGNIVNTVEIIIIYKVFTWGNFDDFHKILFISHIKDRQTVKIYYTLIGL